jgi:hypothetical protein
MDNMNSGKLPTIGVCRCNPPIFIYQGFGQFPQTYDTDGCETGFIDGTIKYE